MSREQPNCRDRVAKRERRRGKYRFTKEDCRRGYQAALQTCMQDWDLYAWFHRRVLRYYRQKE